MGVMSKHSERDKMGVHLDEVSEVVTMDKIVSAVTV